ncbi:MAG: acetylxylan esterase [Verrucomicrobia bacterium]|nr:acetylxylan esterase [Verrucomicrobiota bacterium]
MNTKFSRLTALRVAFAICTCLLVLPRSFAASPAETRAAFLKILDRPRVALKAEASATGETNGLAYFHFTYASDADSRVPGLLVKTANVSTRRPVVIVAHGTGGSKESQLAYLRRFANAGFVAVAIDGRYAGERITSGKGTQEYNAAIARAFATGQGHPFYYDTVWDLMRLVDYLETRDDVDAKRVGLIGFSKGGIETYFTAAADPRITVAVPCIGVQSFRWALENNAWKGRVGTIQSAFNAAAKEAGVTEVNADFVKKFYDRVVPGIYSDFDGPVMLTLIAPRPLFVINGDSDDKTPVPGIELCAAAARAAYRNAKAEEKFVLRIQPDTGHKVNEDSLALAQEWFVKWLKP